MKTAYLLSSAMLLALAAPAYAQQVGTSITQQTTGSINQGNVGDGLGNGNNDVSIYGSGNVTAFAGQTANNVANAIGPQAYVAVGSPYSIQQGAGNYPTTGIGGETTFANPAGYVDQSAVNIIAAHGAPGTSNTVTAGGYQSGSNQINVANIAPVTGSTGSLVQASGDTSQDAFNGMFAHNDGTGSAAIIGSNGAGGAGYQSAFGSLNTASVFVTGGAVATNTTDPTYGTTLDSNQKLFGDTEISSVNLAIANTSATSGPTTIDPSISNLNQAAQISINQLGFSTQGTTTGTGSSAVTTYAAGNVALTGNQGLPASADEPEDGTTPGMISATLGNTAVAYAGHGGVSSGYGLLGNAGVGTAQVSGVTQYASLSLNGISGGAGTSINLGGDGYGGTDPNSGFNQSVSGETQQIGTPNANGGNAFDGYGLGIINGMGALTGSGNASITGAAFTPGNYTQAANIQQNSISTGGSLSGIATQNATDIASNGFGGINNDGPGLGYSNVAAAASQNGSASLKNVSQYMGQSLNTVAANGTSTGLTLNQNAGGTGDSGVYLGGNNVQIASGTTGSSILGGVQVVSNSVNVASLGGISGNITQSANNVGTSANNTMATSLGPNTGFNSSASGSQSTSSQINVIK